jgi:hypothetical protein
MLWEPVAAAFELSRRAAVAVPQAKENVVGMSTSTLTDCCAEITALEPTLFEIPAANRRQRAVEDVHAVDMAAVTPIRPARLWSLALATCRPRRVMLIAPLIGLFEVMKLLNSAAAKDRAADRLAAVAAVVSAMPRPVPMPALVKQRRLLCDVHVVASRPLPPLPTRRVPPA